jgi:lipid-A-disaccharide synthase-like uncharacterized protein
MHPSPEGFLAPFLSPYLPFLYHESLWWTVLGYVATFTFSGRFVIQWLHSEKARKIVVPALFWHLSLWGSVLQLIYLLHCDKAPLILGYVFLPAIYARSLYLHYHHKPVETPEE